MYINSLHTDRDFHVSLEARETISQYYNLLSITSCAYASSSETTCWTTANGQPDYVMTMPEQRGYRAAHDEGRSKQVKRLCLGKMHSL